MLDDLSFDLHALVARLDRSADGILRAELGVSYRRFIVLFMVAELGADTQRAVAEKLNVSEPSISRMATVLAEEGLLRSARDRGVGNRRRLSLTAQGEQLVADCRALLADRFRTLVELSGISAASYARHTRRLLAALDEGEAGA